MNRNTFNDAVKGKKANLYSGSGDMDGDSDDEGAGRKRMTTAIDGEEVMSKEVSRFNEDGEEIEAFNLNEEREGGDGYFDENMNYVFKKGKGEEDTWLAELNEADVEKSIGEAAMAKSKRDARIEKEQMNISQRVVGQSTPNELKQNLLEILLPEETVSEAMRRLSGVAIIKKKSSSEDQIVRRRRKNNNEGDIPTNHIDSDVSKTEESNHSDEKAANKATLLVLTDIADELLSVGGHSSIYQLSRKAIEASLYKWEYRTFGEDGKDHIHGPFTVKEISAWKSQGYFTGNSAVQMRRVVKMITSGKRKVEFDINDEDMKAKRIKATEDLLGDLDSDDDDADDDKVDVGTDNKNALEVVAVDLLVEKNDWVSSDDIDFGIWVEAKNNSKENEIINSDEDE